MFDKGILIHFPFFQTFSPFLINYFYLETLFHFSWSFFFLSSNFLKSGISAWWNLMLNRMRYKKNEVKFTATLPSVTLWQIITYPNEPHPEHQVLDPGGQWLEGGIGSIRPHGGDLVVEEAGIDSFQLLRHHHQTLDGLLDGFQRALDKQRIKAHEYNDKENSIRHQY